MVYDIVLAPLYNINHFVFVFPLFFEILYTSLRIEFTSPRVPLIILTGHRA